MMALKGTSIESPISRTDWPASPIPIGSPARDAGAGSSRGAENGVGGGSCRLAVLLKKFLILPNIAFALEAHREPTLQSVRSGSLICGSGTGKNILIVISGGRPTLGSNSASPLIIYADTNSGVRQNYRNIKMENSLTQPKILLVDDDQDFLDLYREILSQHLSCLPDVRVASTGARALALLESEQFHLLIVDLNLPKMDGLQVLSIDRKSTRLNS